MQYYTFNTPRSKAKKNAQVVAKIPLAITIAGQGTPFFPQLLFKKSKDNNGVAKAHVNFLESTTTGRFKFLSFEFF